MPMRTICHLFFAFLLLLFVSCGADKADEIPEGIPDREEMIQIFADIHTADAAVEYMKIEEIEEILKYKKSFFISVLRNYGMTEDEFYTAYRYYSRNVEDFAVLYDDVIKELSVRDAFYQGNINTAKTDSTDVLEEVEEKTQ
jgi:hypothetical protein